MEGDLNTILDEISEEVCEEAGLSLNECTGVVQELEAETRQILMLLEMKHSELQFKLRVKMQEALLVMPVEIRNMKLSNFSREYSETDYEKVLSINNV